MTKDLTAIVNARVFDGKKVLPEHTTVVITSGEIVLLRGSVPAEAKVIDGTGGTLLPGLMDSHVHTSEDGLRVALTFGVTTELEMGGQRTGSQCEKFGRQEDLADLRTAGMPLTAPCGHPNQLIIGAEKMPTPNCGCNQKHMAFPSPESVGEAVEFVAKIVKDGSHYIKVILEEGSVVGFPGLPVLRKDILNTIVREAHSYGKLVLAHALTEALAIEAVEAGVDGLAHGFLDTPPKPETISRLKDAGVFMTPCLVLNRSITGSTGEAIASHPAVKARLSAKWMKSLCGTFSTYLEGHYQNCLDVTLALHQAGVPILAGTDTFDIDTGYGGMAEGASLHDELGQLVQAGLSPIEALQCATSIPARIFGLVDRGRIAHGFRADLLLVDGDPTVDIQQTLSIRNVWKAGVLQNPV